MMSKKKSSKWAGAKALYMIPLVCVALAAFARVENVYAAVGQTLGQVVADKGNENKSEPLPLYIVDGKESTKAEVDKIFPEDIDNISVLKDASATALYGDKAKKGAVIITLKENISRPHGAVRTPAAKQLAGNADKDGNLATVELPKTIDGNNQLLVQPQYPGGMQALMKFFTEHLKYPEEAAKNNWEGCPICQFVVECDGSITDIKVSHTSGYEILDKAAIQLVASMPNWEPGKNDKNETVRVKYALPLAFMLPPKKDEKTINANEEKQCE